MARSTAGKLLARLVGPGDAERHVGSREGGRRLPDRFTLKGVAIPAAHAPQVGDATGTAGVSKTTKAKGDTPPGARQGRAVATSSAPAKPERLTAGGLDPLVLEFLANHSHDGPHGPTQIANALGRSSGAVGNCLVRLLRTGGLDRARVLEGSPGAAVPRERQHQMESASNCSPATTPAGMLCPRSLAFNVTRVLERDDRSPPRSRARSNPPA